MCILFAPWYYTLFLCTIGLVVFNHYYESIFAGIFLDILYGTQYNLLLGVPIYSTLMVFVLLIIIKTLTTHIRFYEK